MGLGQPHVQRHDAGLGAEAEQREHEGDAAPSGGRLQRPHGVEAVIAGAGLQHTEAQQDRDRAEVRDQEVKVARAPDLGVAVVLVTRKNEDSAIVSQATMKK